MTAPEPDGRELLAAGAADASGQSEAPYEAPYEAPCEAPYAAPPATPPAPGPLAVERRAVRRSVPGPLDAIGERALRGDALAWEDLYRALYPKLVAYARSRLGPDRAKDAAAEAMARAVRGSARVDLGRGGVEGWIFGILRHVVADEQRASSRRALLPWEEGVSDLSAPDDALLAEEETFEVRSAFSLLGPAEQEILRLRVVCGLSAEAVAEILGKRPGAIRMAQARALARLRAKLREVRS